ncbi:cation-translocating P-type ATPase [Pontibacter chitinilyticus]|uniref:cation-translocating P-type ATPase n=1 Tax=Pontibacter chitinilyticus TaxID=2674989 RepID=UPI00321B8547
MEKQWYQLKVEDVFQLLQTRHEGLQVDEVKQRQEQYGLNNMPEPKPKTLLRIFLSQFLNPLIYVLMAAGTVSLLVQDLENALFIFSIILINACLGTWQEGKAERNATALRNLVKIRTRVRREGNVYDLDAQQLVPGDIVLLESGMKVPCDLRLAEVQELTLEEGLLTGESLPVQKTSSVLEQEAPSLGDRSNMAFAATTVIKGRAWGIATATGVDTELGKIAGSLAVTETEKPPLLRRMDVFSRTISQLVLLLCLVLGLVGWWRGMAAFDIFFFMVALAVSAIPEGLPVALTVALAIGTSRMAKRNVIIRKLPAVEGLGSCTLIASDKTGTLTMDQQSAKKLVLADGEALLVSGQGYNGEGTIETEAGTRAVLTPSLAILLQTAVLCNEGSLRQEAAGWEYSGDSVDVALLALAFKAGQEPAYFRQQLEVVKQVSYESENKFSGLFYLDGGQLFFAMKGAAEVVARHVGQQKEFLLQQAGQLAMEGYRVIGLAVGPATSTDVISLGELEFAGLIGLIDPLRAEVVAAVKACQQAGLKVVMVTGDHPVTAVAIARQLGIATSDAEVITGQEMAALQSENPSAFLQVMAEKRVFARVAPLQKKDIVETMKRNNHFVAVTGDGANDAPALKAAHIGVAMGSGTDVAKEAASIIVTDNNFASIAAGIEEGRFTYENLRKIIYMLISTGAAELLLVALTLLLGLPLPFIAVQLLWLNLVTNGIQDIALALEKGDPAVMQLPPRKPDEPVFDPLMWKEILLSAAVMVGLTFGLWYWLVEGQGMDVRHARTDLMMLMVLLQNFHVLNCRSEFKSLFQVPLRNNYLLIAGIVGAQLVHISAAYVPFLASILELEPVQLNEWLKLLPTAAVVLGAMELFKWLRSRSVKNRLKRD